MEKTILEQLAAFDREMASSSDNKPAERHDFSKPIPEGDGYKVKVIELGEWEARKGAYVILKNDDGVWVDESGKPIERGTSPVRKYDENHEYLTRQLNLEIVEGEQKGRRIYHNVDTIVDDAWKVSALLEALGVSAVSRLNFDDIKDTVFLVDIKHGKPRERIRTKIDQNTGVETEEKVVRTPVYIKEPRPIKPKTKIVGGIASAVHDGKELDMAQFLLEDF